MTVWYLMHPRMTAEMLGLIPSFFHDNDPRSAREQIDDRYAHGGGWRPIKGFRLLPSRTIQYYDAEGPEEPLPVLAYCHLRDEVICFYAHCWVAIIQPDGSFEVSRLD